MILKESSISKLLIVDDKAENIVILLQMLESINVEFFIALNGKDALGLVISHDFDLILLDVVMPIMDGYQVCTKIKNNPQTKDIPLIFISALSGVEDKIKGFSCGADDYITKPFLQKELIARVKLHLHKSMLIKSLKQLLRRSYHELYNPLAIINTSIELQNIKYGNNRYVDAITVASRTLRLVYDDLYYSLSSREQHEKILSIDLVKFLRERINYFYHLTNNKNINIVFEYLTKSKIPMREADLLRIVDNTLSNAMKHAKEDTTIFIEVKNNEESVLFRCQNSGSTIKNPHMIFEKGYRENFEQIGMGIGLEIVASICHIYEIKAEVTSVDGVTTFKYEIPKVPI
ncbi:MAG: hybrid sensor histidine kinase/response regulator [Sulfurimonas sp.]|jgi:DNA-binding response OmpR family regulator